MLPSPFYQLQVFLGCWSTCFQCHRSQRSPGTCYCFSLASKTLLKTASWPPSHSRYRLNMPSKWLLSVSVHLSVNMHHISNDLSSEHPVSVSTYGLNMACLSSVLQSNLTDCVKAIYLQELHKVKVFRQSYRMKVTCHRQHQDCTVWFLDSIHPNW